MERRSFLLGASALLLSELLVGCGQKNQATLKVEFLSNSIPGQVVYKFSDYLQKTQKTELNFSPVGQLQALFQQLYTWQKKTNTKDKEWYSFIPIELRRFIPFTRSQNIQPADLVTLGDYWISAAIEQKLIQPLEVEQLKHWSTLPKGWQEFVKRNNKGEIDPQGKVWGAPYRWGTTVIVYHRDKFPQEWGWTPRDWGDLWRSELQGQISLLDQPREVIGLVLKKLGKSYNTESLNAVPDLEKELRKLNEQVKFYSSDRYIEPLISGDTWLAVGWSNDVLPILVRYPQLAAVIPQSGTAIWADLWVNPAGRQTHTLSSQWIDFCWSENIAKDISVLTKSNTPIPITLGKSDIPDKLRNLLVIDSEVFGKSEFLRPLPPTIATQYDVLFAKMKS